MFKLAVTVFAVAQVAYCQYASSGASTASGMTAATTMGGMVTTTMGGVVTTGSSAKGDCTSATDSVYLAHLKIHVGLENELSAVLAANPNAKADNSSGFFLGTIVGAAQENQVLQNINNGQTVTGAVCLSNNQMLGNTITQTIAHANDVVPQPLTGENKYQDLLQRLGQSFNTLLNDAAACQGYSTNAGPWLTIILNLSTNVKAIQTVVANNDSSNNCLTASKALAVSLNGILSAGNASG